MFVSRTTYNKLKSEHETTQASLIYMRTENHRLASELADTVRRYNAFVKQIEGMVFPTSNQFSPEEIRTLINLCHPDKHDGKASAVSITQKLLQLRRKR